MAGPPPSDMRRTDRTRDLLDELEARRLNPYVVSATDTAGVTAHGVI